MIGHLLDDAVNVFRPTRTADAMGGHSTTFAQVGTGPVPCRIEQPGDGESFEADRPGSELDYRIRFEAGADVSRGDELRHSDGRVWRVLATLGPSTPGVYLRAHCELRQDEGD